MIQNYVARLKTYMILPRVPDPVYTGTGPNGSVPKLALIGLPLTLDLWICTHLRLLSGPIWGRSPRCTTLDWIRACLSLV